MLGHLPSLHLEEVTESEFAPEFPDQSVQDPFPEGALEKASVHEGNGSFSVELSLVERASRLLDVEAVAQGLLQELHSAKPWKLEIFKETCFADLLKAFRKNIFDLKKNPSTFVFSFFTAKI